MHGPRPHSPHGLGQNLPQICCRSARCQVPSAPWAAEQQTRGSLIPPYEVLTGHCLCVPHHGKGWAQVWQTYSSQIRGFWREGGRHWKGKETQDQRIGGPKGNCHLVICLAHTPLPVTTATPNPYTHTPQLNQRTSMDCLLTATEVGLWDSLTPACFDVWASCFPLVPTLLRPARRGGPRTCSTWQTEWKRSWTGH